MWYDVGRGPERDSNIYIFEFTVFMYLSISEDELFSEWY